MGKMMQSLSESWLVSISAYENILTLVKMALKSAFLLISGIISLLLYTLVTISVSLLLIILTVALSPLLLYEVFVR